MLKVHGADNDHWWKDCPNRDGVEPQKKSTKVARNTIANMPLEDVLMQLTSSIIARIQPTSTPGISRATV